MAAKKVQAKAKIKTKATPAKREPDPVRVPQTTDRRARLEAVISQINNQMKHKVVRLANETSSSYLLRRPTGITSLDIALVGGIPASAPIVIVGPDSAGKDYLLWRICAETQRIYGEDFAMAVYLTEFRPDKRYMRDYCGLKIAMSDAELDEIDLARSQQGLDPLSEEDRNRYQEQVGKIFLIYGVTAEEGFDAVIDLVSSNGCQIVAVNSIGFLQTEAKEDTESFKDFAQRSNEAILLSKFLPKLMMTLNRDLPGDERNETSLILINQVRSKDNVRPIPGRPVMDKDKYRPAVEAHALKHGKALELMVHNGKKIYDEESQIVLGREKQWEFLKGKLGFHEGVRGNFKYFFDTGADIVGDLIDVCKQLGIFQVSGSWVEYSKDGDTVFRCQGDGKIRAYFRDNPEVIDELRDACFRKSGIVYRHR